MPRDATHAWFTGRPAPDPAWASRGSCGSHPDPDLWFADESDTPRRHQAETICRACPVAADCLRYALALPALHGIWAATTPRQRTKLRNGTPGPVPPRRNRAA